MPDDIYYQTDALSKSQCSLIAEALKVALAQEINGVNNPEKVRELTELSGMFNDPSGNLIEVDAPEDELEDEDEEDTGDDD